MGDSLPPLPPDLQPYTVPTGVHNRWPSISVFGPWKSGKSTFLSSFPPPMVVIDAGDQGIGMYLPPNDPRYVCIQTSDPNQVNQIVDWAIENEEKINSFIVDPATMLWKDHLDWYQEYLGVDEIKGGMWKDVKGPWGRRFYRLRRANFYKGYAFRIKDIEYITGEAAPGEKGPLIIRAHEAPDWEKNMGYVTDQIYECQNRKDQLGKPTPLFEVTFWGGRRPRSISPEELPIGRTWRFDSRKPESVWDAVIAPYLEAYQVDALEHYGVDKEEAKKALQEMKQDYEDGQVGKLIREVEEFTGSLKDYQQFFPRIARESASLSAEGKARVKSAHEKKKGELK